MSDECFEIEIQDEIAHIRFARPERFNSMTLDFWNELPKVIDNIDNKGAARVIVISSTGKHFTSGMDLSVFGSNNTLSGNDSPITRGAGMYELVKRFQNTVSCLENARMPVLAAIQGGCIGGGMDLVTAADMRYATTDAFFCIQEINIGMTADVGTFPRLTRLIPEGLAKELAYTGRRMTAAEALDAGLINRIYPNHEEMLSGVMETAQEISKKAPLAIFGTKQIINYSKDHTTSDTLDYISIWNASMLQPKEMQEAIKANAEKRKGDFENLPPRTKTN
tara:strand:- start:548 stop:1384 length:837 start_codon:yes stop_codon:yes gene_type:complete